MADLTECQLFALDHHFCGYEYIGRPVNSTCGLVTGSACKITASARSDGAILGQMRCNFSDVQTARVDVNQVTKHTNTEFADFSLTPSASKLSALDSAVYTIGGIPTADACKE